MSLELVELGSEPNDGTGDDLHTAGEKINAAIAMADAAIQPGDFSKYLNYAGLIGYTGALDLSGNTTIEKVNIFGSGITTFNATGCNQLNEIIFNYQVSTVVLSGNTLLPSVNLTGLSPLTDFQIISAPLVTSLDFTNNLNLQHATIIVTPITAIGLHNNTDLVQIECAATAISSIDLSNNTLLTNIDIDSNPNLASIDISANTLLEHVDLSYLPLVTSIDISANSAITYLSFEGGALDQAAVDGILASLDGFGLSGGYCHLTLGTNASPSGAGLASKTSLEGKSWTVHVN